MYDGAQMIQPDQLRELDPTEIAILFNENDTQDRQSTKKEIIQKYRDHLKSAAIMEDGETLVFIEVKSRTNRRYGEPKEAVTPFKQQHVRYTAKAFACSRHIEGRRIRFDVVEVMQMADGTVKFHHIRNAF